MSDLPNVRVGCKGIRLSIDRSNGQEALSDTSYHPEKYTFCLCLAETKGCLHAPLENGDLIHFCLVKASMCR
jgi:hypothetical protein